MIPPILARLGSDWQSEDDGDKKLPAFFHIPTALRFRLISGGALNMGMTDQDFDTLLLFADGYASEVESLRKSATPVRHITVAPFLCTEEPLTGEVCARLQCPSEPSRAQALQAANRLGFRLPSEAELEWIFRDGVGAPFVTDLTGKNTLKVNQDGNVTLSASNVASRFGIRGLPARLWAADDWFPDYDGAPADARARVGGDPVGVCRGEELSNVYCGGTELAWSLASAARWKPGDSGRVLLVHDLNLP